MSARVFCFAKSPWKGECRRKKGHEDHHRDGDGGQWDDDGTIIREPRQKPGAGKPLFWPSIPRGTRA